MSGTPYEGGVRAPAFIVDFSKNQKYLSSIPPSQHQNIHEHNDTVNDNINNNDGNINNHDNDNNDKRYRRVYHGMMHVSDWLPTLLSYADILSTIDASISILWDGYDFSNYFRYDSIHEDMNIINYNLNTTCPTIRIPHDHADDVDNDNNNNNDHDHDGRRKNSPRNSILIDMYDSNNSVFKESLVSYRYDDDNNDCTVCMFMIML